MYFLSDVLQHVSKGQDQTEPLEFIPERHFMKSRYPRERPQGEKN